MGGSLWSRCAWSISVRTFEAGLGAVMDRPGVVWPRMAPLGRAWRGPTDRRGLAWRGWAGPGLAWLGLAGFSNRLGKFRPGGVRRSSAWRGLAGFSQVVRAWQGGIRLGRAGYGSHRSSWQDMAGHGRAGYGGAWLGEGAHVFLVWRVWVWHGAPRRGDAGFGRVIQIVEARPRMAPLGVARRGTAGRGIQVFGVRCGTAGSGKVWQG